MTTKATTPASQSNPHTTIRLLHTVEDCRNFQEVQRRVWIGAQDDIVPVHVLITQAKNGGLLLGAFCDNGPDDTDGMVGIALGWPGLDSTHGSGAQPYVEGAGPRRAPGTPGLKFCSHMVGVLPAFHGQGIGLRLKLAQRDHLLAAGHMHRATWTYDPLLRVNAVLNIHRLGAVCTTYLRNVYGEMTDQLNAGMPTDRCQVDWYLRSDHVSAAIAEQRQDRDWAKRQLEVLPTRMVEGEYAVRVPAAVEATLDGRPLAVPIPHSVQALRDAGQDLPMAWRLFMRNTLERAFAARYCMTDCAELDGGVWHYILVPDSLVPGSWKANTG